MMIAKVFISVERLKGPDTPAGATNFYELKYTPHSV